jgi:hypothetical protein
MSKTQFDMPHALVTLTDVEGNVEIEVWPKTGQSAYVVVPPAVARAIAEHLAHMADAAEAGGGDPEEDVSVGAPENVVSLAARRKRSDA